MSGTMEGCQIHIKGIVQGVGFRPHVYRLAASLNVKGWVLNSSSGVLIEAEAPTDNIKEFARAVVEGAPPLAVITQYSITPVPVQGYSDFTIRVSAQEDKAEVMISPDIAICTDCQREMSDPRDRRFGYPFINCTNCGPRFTIIWDVPYDRAMTTMADFPMCPQCKQEYENPLHRRFHAQPNACPVCGPQISLINNLGEASELNAAQLLKVGCILAIKGLGGFHLAVDASNATAVTKLRARKQRDAKPFAVMARDLAVVRKYCQLSSSEEKWLTSPQAPIVILERNHNAGLPDYAIHPGINTLGVMLPYTPLHYLLFAEDLELLVMTSANISDDPLIINNDEALRKLGGIADYFLLHNRDIFNVCDDSVIRVTEEQKPQFYRRARGFVPQAVNLPIAVKPVLAVGGEMKNSFCLTKGRFAFLSQHQGDINHYQNYLRFQEAIPRFQKMVNVEPQKLAHDLHPGYQTTHWAKEQSLPKIAVQHHHAHMASVMAENGLAGEVLALICDGTGYGTDGAIWGGEILSGGYKGFTRRGHLGYVPLPGGDISISKPYRMTLVYLQAALGTAGIELADYWLPTLGPIEREMLLQQIAWGINTVPTSSCGRLFDAVSALLGICPISRYEGQAAVELENQMSEDILPGYDYLLEEENGQWIMNVLPMWRSIVDDLLGGCSPAEISRKFHAGIAALFTDALLRTADKTGLKRVVLSGGSFYNRYLLSQVCSQLTDCGLQVYYHQQVPTGDGGLSLGQAIIASEVSN